MRLYINEQQQIDSQTALTFNEPFNYRMNALYHPGNLDLISNRIDHLLTTTDSHVIKNHNHHLNMLSDRYHASYERFKSLDLYTICMIRRNIFECALSRAIAGVTRQHVTYDNVLTDIRINPIAMRRHVHNCLFTTDSLLTNLHKFHYSEVLAYEDLTFDPRTDFLNRRIAGFHDVDDLQVTDYVHKAPNKRDQVINYGELYDITIEKIEEFSQQPLLEFDGVVITNNLKDYEC